MIVSFPMPMAASRFSRSHLSVQYNPQNDKIEEKGDDITQHDAEMKSIERLYGKDPKTVVRLKQPGRDGQSEMGNEDDNKGQQE